MFDSFLHFLTTFREFLTPWTIVNCYEKGVLLRNGKQKACLCHKGVLVLEPGWHWIFPLGIDEVLTETVVLNTTHCGAQSLTTKDGVSVVVNAMVIYEIADIETYLLKVEGRGGFMTDCVYAGVSEHVINTDFADLLGDKSYRALRALVRRSAKRYGVEVEAVKFADVVKARSLRLWQQN